MTIRLLLLTLLSALAAPLAAGAHPSDFVLQFRAKNIRDGVFLPLDSVKVRNLARGRDTTLIGVTSLIVAVATDAGKEAPAPEGLMLSGNYTNPFSDETRVRVSVGEPGALALALHDLRGRLIAVNMEPAERGRQEYLIDGRGLAPGIYILSARTRGAVRAIRMVKTGAAAPRAVTIARLGSGRIPMSPAAPASKTEGLPGDDYRFIGFIGAFMPDTIFANVSAGGEYIFSIHADYLPLVETFAAANVTTTAATGGGRVLSGGGSPVKARGVCWNSFHVPTLADSASGEGAGTGAFTSVIAGLSPRTMYYVRAYAVNDSGVGYGPAAAFVTAQDGSGTLTDIDGNVYRTVVLGTQTWMAENLNVTRARTGDAIPEAKDAAGWSARKTAAWCHFDNDPANSIFYGRLYNYAAAADSPAIAPAGWHVPSDDEWQRLVDYLGGDAVAGGRMKEAGTAHWLAPNEGATNESGFAAPGSGRRDLDGFFIERRAVTRFWSTTANHSTNSWIRALSSGNAAALYDNENKRSGLSIRCVKD